jgi:hypothetical protein
MPRLLRDFPTTEPGSVGVYSIDFAQNVPPGSTLQSASWSLGVHFTVPYATADANPNSHLVGQSSISGTVASQRISGLVDGNDYLVSVTGTMSDGEVVVLWTVLPCRAPS